MNGCDIVLEGKGIYITGSRQLDNEALACFLAKATGFRCQAVSFERVEALSGQIEPQESGCFFSMPSIRRIQAMIIDRQNGAKGNGFHLSGLFSRLFQENSNGSAPGREETPGPYLRLSLSLRFVGSVPRGCPGSAARSEIRAGRAACTLHADEDRSRPCRGTPAEPREFHILFMMAGGLNNKDIAARSTSAAIPSELTCTTSSGRSIPEPGTGFPVGPRARGEVLLPDLEETPAPHGSGGGPSPIMVSDTAGKSSFLPTPAFISRSSKKSRRDQQKARAVPGGAGGQPVPVSEGTGMLSRRATTGATRPSRRRLRGQNRPSRSIRPSMMMKAVLSSADSTSKIWS